MMSVVLLTAILSAQPATTPYELDPVIDGTLILVPSVVSALTRILVDPGLSATPDCKLSLNGGYCDKMTLLPIDRLAIGQDSGTWLILSDALQGVAVGLPLILSAIDIWTGDSDDKLFDYLTDTAIMLESFAITLFLTGLLKHAVRRPRPSQYSPPAGRPGVGSLVSFPSGHTSFVASITTTFAMTVALRHPDTYHGWVAFSGAFLMTALTGIARVGAGRHFPTDVIGGGVLGIGVGILVPYLRRKVPMAGVTMGAELVTGGATVRVGGKF